MYCGIGRIPKGKIRGTPEYCVQTNQIRYYGLKKIDESLLKKAKGTATNLIKEQLKLKKIEDEAKILIKEVKNLKVLLEQKNIKPTQLKQAQKRMDALLIKRDNLVKRLKSQKKVVDALEEDERQSNKPVKKKISGSKTSKKISKTKKK